MSIPKMAESSAFAAYDFKSSFGSLSRASTRRIAGTREWVYFIQSMDEPFRIKIGKTHNLRFRLMGLQWMSPVPLAMIGAHIWTVRTESLLHECFKDLRSHGEWFYPGENLVAFIEALGGEQVPEKPRDLLQFLTHFAQGIDVDALHSRFYEGSIIEVNRVEHEAYLKAGAW